MDEMRRDEPVRTEIPSQARGESRVFTSGPPQSPAGEGYEWMPRSPRAGGQVEGKERIPVALANVLRHLGQFGFETTIDDGKNPEKNYIMSSVVGP